MQELTLAVVGLDYANADKSNRRSEAMMTLPGEPVLLVPEPRNKHDDNAIAVIGPRGIQLGYLSAERAPYVGGRIARGEEVIAIFQAVAGAFPYIRARFGGGAPTLPAADTPASSRSTPVCDPQDFFPDDDGSERGA